MNSFTLQAIGNLMKDPETNVKGDRTYTRFCLVGNDYAGKDEGGDAREATTTIWMVAFGSIGDAIAKNSRKGDQLFVYGHIRSNNWEKDGEMQYDHSFIVDGFRLGAPGKAKREQLSRISRSELLQLPPSTPNDEANEELATDSTLTTALRPETHRHGALS